MWLCLEAGTLEGRMRNGEWWGMGNRREYGGHRGHVPPPILKNSDRVPL